MSHKNKSIKLNLKNLFLLKIWIHDELPNQICATCLDDLQSAFKFKQTAELSDIELRKILQNNTEINDIDEHDKLSIKSEIEEKLKYSCDECNFTCNHLQHLGLHKKRYHSAKGERCKFCNLVFYHKLQFEAHLKSHNKCNKVFKTSSKLVHHSLVHATDSLTDKRIPCSVCGKHVVKRHIKRHLNVHKNNRDLIKCPRCDKKFLHQSSIKTHIRRDHERIAHELKYLCNTCGKKFSSRIGLERHSVVHKPDRPYECIECGQAFKLNFSLTKHIKTKHSNINVYHVRIPCKICSKQISKTNMQTHMRIHKNNRNLIKCSQCSKTFLHEISLKQHVERKHENIARSLKHLCNVCGKGAGSLAELDLHMRTHSDEKTFECDKCGIKYKSRAGLTHHVKTMHLNIKPYTCTVCSQRFALRATLTTHMRTHTGEKPFSCVICEKPFSQKSSLRTHMKLVHSNVILYTDVKNTNNDDLKCL